MKLLIASLFLSTITYGQCSTRNIVITPGIGYAHPGPTIYTEVGSHSSVPLTLSYFAGVQIAERKEKDYYDDDKNTPAMHTVQYVDVYGRIALKISGTEGESNFYHFITAFGSARGNIGASYRLYKSFDNVLVGIEPNYSLQHTGGINLIITSRF